MGNNWWEAFGDQINAAVQRGIQRASGQSPDDSVYWDDVMTAPRGQGVSEHTRGVPQPTRLSTQAQQQKVYSYFADPNKRVPFAVDLYRIGALGSTRGFTDIGYFNGAAARAIQMYKASGSSMSFTQWLASTAAKSDRPVPGMDSGSGGRAYGGGGGGGGGGSQAFTNVTTTLTNRDDARSTIDAALGEWLGRSATKKEVDKFWAALNKHERKNPNVDTGVAGPGGTTAVRGGGSNSQVFAEDYAKSQDDYAETTFATSALELIKKSIMGDTTEGLM